MDTSPITSHILDLFYHVNGDTFEKQYKEKPSGYRTWKFLSHADKRLVFPENVGPHLAMDETGLSEGEFYSVVTSRNRHGGEGCLVAIVAGTKAEVVIEALNHIPEEIRETVEEITLDLSDSMRKIVRGSFPGALRVTDRFHIQKLACDAVREIRIKHRWDAIQEDNDKREEAKITGERYEPVRYDNGDTKKELLAGSRYLLFKSGEKWTPSQRKRAEILFKEYPDLEKAYGLSHALRMIFVKNTIRNAARLSLAKWYNKVEEAGFHSFNVIAAIFYEHYDDILNFYNNRSSNAAAESFNAKIKAFRAALRGVIDVKFFLFRLAMIYAYPY
jgi:transposase